MLTKIELKFTVIYSVIVLLELISRNYIELETLHYLAKPLIVLSLLTFLIKQGQHIKKQIKSLMIFALVFSIIGDIALLFDGIQPLYFITGLGAFLFAHVMYVLVFLKQRDSKRKPISFILLMLVYAVFLFYLLKEGLGDLLIPVIVYMIVILSMSTSAFLRQKTNNTISFNWVLIGAILFMISDSILALDKFYQSFTLSSLLIMITYALAQYCILIGILKHSTELR